MMEGNIQAIDLDTEQEPYKIRHKKYLKELEKIKEFYNPKKYRKSNKCKVWKEEWKGYVETTVPWDAGNIFESLVFRLEVLQANLFYFGHHVGSEDDAKEIGEVVKLGRKILNDSAYHDEAHEYAEKHCKHYTSVYKKGNSAEKTNSRSSLSKAINYRIVI